MAIKISKSTNDMDDQKPFEHLTVRELILADHQRTLWMMEEELKNNKEAIHKIVEDIGKWKICNTFIPHCLICEENVHTASLSGIYSFVEMIIPFFFHSNATGDETWCFQYDPQTNDNGVRQAPEGTRNFNLRHQKTKWCWPHSSAVRE
jgi:hypothetical protein